MKKKIIFGVATVILATVMVVVVLVLLDPLRSSPQRIRAAMLKHTPIGMSMEEVIGVIENNDTWEIDATRENGYIMRGRRPYPDIDFRFVNGNTIIGVKSMRVYIGSYNFFFFAGRTTVYAYYGFDEDSKLVDIAVGKRAIHI